MRTKPIYLLILAVAIAAASLATHAASQIYRWTDEDGVVHFGSIVPEGIEAELVGVRPNTVPISRPAKPDAEAEETNAQESDSTETLSVAEQRRQDRAERRRTSQEEAAKLARQCAIMQAQKDFLEPSPRVIVRDEDGGVRRLDNAERESGLAEANAFLAAHCN